MTMRRFWRNWGFTITFWVLFLGSIALNGRYRVLDKMWLLVCFGALVVFSMARPIHFFRHAKDADGWASYRGMPEWVRRGLGADEHERSSSSKISSSSSNR